MTTYVLNLLDLAFTLRALSHGAVELNPLMRCVPVMIVYKVIGMGLLLRWISPRQEPVARYGLKVITALYAAVDLWHIYNLIWIGGIP